MRYAWYLFQLAVLFSNVHWRWTPNGYLASLIAIAARLCAASRQGGRRGWACWMVCKLFSMAALNGLHSRQLLAPSFRIVVCDDCAPPDLPGDEAAGFDLAV